MRRASANGAPAARSIACCSASPDAELIRDARARYDACWSSALLVVKLRRLARREGIAEPVERVLRHARCSTLTAPGLWIDPVELRSRHAIRLDAAVTLAGRGEIAAVLTFDRQLEAGCAHHGLHVEARAGPQRGGRACGQAPDRRREAFPPRMIVDQDLAGPSSDPQVAGSLILPGVLQTRAIGAVDATPAQRACAANRRCLRRAAYAARMSYTFRSTNTGGTINAVELTPEQALDLGAGMATASSRHDEQVPVDDDGQIIHGQPAIPQQRDEAA